MATRTAVSAEASATAPASTPVHTSAQPASRDPRKPSPRPQRDQFTGKGGTYQRDPDTGVRTRVDPPAAPAAGGDTPAAA